MKIFIKYRAEYEKERKSFYKIIANVNVVDEYVLNRFYTDKINVTSCVERSSNDSLNLSTHVGFEWHGNQFFVRSRKKNHVTSFTNIPFHRELLVRWRHEKLADGKLVKGTKSCFTRESTNNIIKRVLLYSLYLCCAISAKKFPSGSV